MRKAIKSKRDTGSPAGSTQIGVRIPNDLLAMINNEIEKLREANQISVTKQGVIIASLRSRYQETGGAEAAQS